MNVYGPEPATADHAIVMSQNWPLANMQIRHPYLASAFHAGAALAAGSRYR